MIVHDLRNNFIILKHSFSSFYSQIKNELFFEATHTWSGNFIFFLNTNFDKDDLLENIPPIQRSLCYFFLKEIRRKDDYMAFKEHLD